VSNKSVRLENELHFAGIVLIDVFLKADMLNKVFHRAVISSFDCNLLSVLSPAWSVPLQRAGEEWSCS